jgi:hypothetical protein
MCLSAKLPEHAPRGSHTIHPFILPLAPIIIIMRQSRHAQFTVLAIQARVSPYQTAIILCLFYFICILFLLFFVLSFTVGT